MRGNKPDIIKQEKSNFAKRNVTLVLIGLIISLFGSAIQRFSFSLYLLELTQDAAIFSNVMALSVIPYIVLAPFAGSVADNRNKKHIMILLDLMSFLVILGYVLWNPAGNMEVIKTAVVMFLLASISTFYTPAVTAMIPMIVTSDELVRANAKISQVSSIANLSGPVLAGLLYGMFGIKGVTLINAISFFGSAILELFIVFHETKSEHRSTSMKSACYEMIESYRYLKVEKKNALKFIWSYCMYNICLVPVMSVLMPFVIRTMLNTSSEVYGVVEGVVAAGMIAGALCVSTFPKIFSLRHVYKWDYMMAAAIGVIMFASMGSSKNLALLFWSLGGFLIMMALGIGNVVTLSYTQKIVDHTHLGKVSAFSTAVATVSVPVGQILFGWYMKASSNITVLLLLVLVLNLIVTVYIRSIILKIYDK